MTGGLLGGEDLLDQLVDHRFEFGEELLRVVFATVYQAEAYLPIRPSAPHSLSVRFGWYG